MEVQSLIQLHSPGQAADLYRSGYNAAKGASLISLNRLRLNMDVKYSCERDCTGYH